MHRQDIERWMYESREEVVPIKKPNVWSSKEKISEAILLVKKIITQNVKSLAFAKKEVSFRPDFFKAEIIYEKNSMKFFRTLLKEYENDYNNLDSNTSDN